MYIFLENIGKVRCRHHVIHIIQAYVNVCFHIFTLKSTFFFLVCPDSYTAVAMPMLYNTRYSSRRRVAVMISVVWVLSFAISCPLLFGLNNTGEKGGTSPPWVGFKWKAVSDFYGYLQSIAQHKQSIRIPLLLYLVLYIKQTHKICILNCKLVCLPNDCPYLHQYCMKDVLEPI